MSVDGPAGPPEPTQLLALTATQRLLTFTAADPSTTVHAVSVSGLASGADLVAIGFDYVAYGDWDLYGVGTDSRLYRVDPASGAASPLGSGPFQPALDGTRFALACDALTTGSLHVFSDTGQHLVLSQTTGAVLDAAVLAWAGDPTAEPPEVVAAAFGRETVPSPAVLVAGGTRLLSVDPGRHDVYGSGLSPAGIPVGDDASLVYLYSFYDPPVQAAGEGSAIPPTERGYLAITPAGTSTSRLFFSNHGAPFEDLGVIGGGEPVRGLAGHDDH